MIELGEADLWIQGENSLVLPLLPPSSFQCAYIDPPFNTGRTQQGRRVSVRRDAGGDRTGFQGERYASSTTLTSSYEDSFEDYLGFLRPRLEEIRRLLTTSGTCYIHVDPRESHYVKVLADEVFGRSSFLNEVVWAYDYGGRARDRWPQKHDTILVYVRTPGQHFFDQDAIERIPYMSPGLVGPAKAARGKLPTDVWWHTIVPTRGTERTGYPTQKPEGVVSRALSASSREGDWVLDCFAGSGTTGAVARATGRRSVCVDISPAAAQVGLPRLRAVAERPLALLGPDGTHLPEPS